MSAERHCSSCGVALPANAPMGLCVRCLLGVGKSANTLGVPPTGGAAAEPAEAGTPNQTAPSATVAEKPGDHIGPYKLLEKIGEGGMGTVWMAEQMEPVRRRVALKVIKQGMDSSQVLARFEAERQALALMDHPNIAKIFDAGMTGSPHASSGHPLPSDGKGPSSSSVASGRPYFVMELVKGIPLTKFCDERRLSIRERLELFMPVCQAIQHAHQKGIIHRDISPSNVLVALYDGRPVPKVIDFGIAKAVGQQLTERTLFTGFGAVIGKLEYMSPEQAELNQLDIDTRSDIYSLGVLLYELLTGSTPLTRETLRQAAFDEVLRRIRTEEPPHPSTRLSESKEKLPTISAQRQIDPARLTKLLRGDLDWIVMKALDKDRARRYETANSLAADVQRHLSNEPVAAVAPSVSYRLRKFVRRHRTGVAATVTIVILVLTGVGVSTLLAVKASRAALETRVESSKNELIAEIFGLAFGDLASEMVKGPQRERLRNRLDEAVERLDARPESLPPEARAYVKSVLGDIYFKIGDYSKAEVQQRNALEIRAKRLPPENESIALSQWFLARTLHSTGKLTEAEQLYRKALAIFQNANGSNDEHVREIRNHLALLEPASDTPKILEEAAQGDLEAQLEIGMRYLAGAGVQTNYVEAMHWFRQAAEKGNAQAQLHLGLLVGNERAGSRDVDQARNWIEKAGEHGDPWIQTFVGLLFLGTAGLSEWTIGPFAYVGTLKKRGADSGIAQYTYRLPSPLPIDEAAAARWFRRAAERGDASGQAFLGLMYARGRGVTKSEVEAVRWTRKSTEQTNAVGQNLLGQFYKRGFGVPKNDDQAVHWFHLSAEAGNPDGQFHLGEMFDEGRGVAKNESEAARWYRRAADQDLPAAQYALALMYAEGRGVLTNSVQAVRWLLNAGEQGQIDAQCHLGWMYATGHLLDRNDAEAARWYRKAAEQGDIGAQNYLAGSYRHGRGVTQNLAHAVTWWRKAAEQGDARAQCDLGAAFAVGDGIGRDEAEAVRWYRKSAEQSFPHACYNLAEAYAKGRGTETNEMEAIRWYRKAAELGDTDAQANMAWRYETGRGVTKDIQEAIRWYRHSAEKDHHYSQNELAWLLATSPQDDVRNGKEAVRWALRSCEASKFNDAHDLDTLAAAYAETGKFPEAVKHLQTAQRLAKQSVSSKEMDEFRKELEARSALYQQQKSFRDSE